MARTGWHKVIGSDRGLDMLSKNIRKLVQYGIETGLTPACEKNYTINLLLDVFKEDEYTEPEEEFAEIDLEEVLGELLMKQLNAG